MYWEEWTQTDLYKIDGESIIPAMAENITCNTCDNAGLGNTDPVKELNEITGKKEFYSY